MSKLTALLLLLGACSLLSAQKIVEDVHWADFLAKQDPIWSFRTADAKSLSTAWYDAPFAGNGNLGVMVYNGKYNNKHAIQIDIGRADVWDHRMKSSPYAVHNNEYDRIRLDTGRFYLVPVGDIVEGTLRINLYDAVLNGTVRTSKGSLFFQAHVNADNYIIVFEVIPSPEEEASQFVYVPGKTVLPRGEHANYKHNPDAVCATQTDEVNTCQYSMLAGGDYAVAWKRTKTPNGYRVYMTVDNSVTFNVQREKSALDGSMELIQKFASADLSALLQAHKAFWHDYYSKSFVSIPYKHGESFYWIQLYKLASATKCTPTNCWAYDLMGPWYQTTVWSDFHFDLNVQIAAWPIWTANHPESFESVNYFTKKNFQYLVESVPPAYQNDSAAAATETGWDWGIEGESWGSTRGYVQPPGSILGNLNWLCHTLYTHYKFTQDKTQLKEVVYPTLKRATQYYYRLLTKKADGKYHLPNAMSPEYASCEDTNWDLGLYRWSVKTMSEIVRILGIEEPLLEQWEETVDHLAPYSTDSTQGYLIGAGTHLSGMHRHWSHLLMIYPLHLQDYEMNPDLADVMTKSIDHWMSFNPNDNAYSIAISSIFSQMIPGRDEQGWKYFLDAFKLYRIGASTMYWEASAAPVNESPFAVAHVLQFMLLRSDTGLIDIFPANISALNDAVIHNWRAEGGVLVSAVRKNGQTSWLSLTALQSGSFRFRVKDILDPDHEPASIHVGPAKPGVYVVQLGKGQTVFVYPRGQKPSSYTISMIDGKSEDYNSWGKH